MKIFAVTVALIVHALPLYASTEHLDSSELRSRIASSGRLFSLEAKYGDGSEGPSSELDLSGGLGQSMDSASHDWVSNREETFSLHFDSGWVRFELGEVSLGFALENYPENLYFECIAEADRSALTIIDLRLDDIHLGASCWTLGPAGRSILWIDVEGLADGFELTGTVNFAWIGDSLGPEALSFTLGATSGGGVVEERSWSQIKRLY